MVEQPDIITKDGLVIDFKTQQTFYCAQGNHYLHVSFKTKSPGGKRPICQTCKSNVAQKIKDRSTK